MFRGKEAIIILQCIFDIVSSCNSPWEKKNAEEQWGQFKIQGQGWQWHEIL